MRCGDFRQTYRQDMAIFDSSFARWAMAGFLVILAAAPLVTTSLWLDVMNRILIAVIAATGLNVLTGFTGQISLGNAAFLAVGAYTTAYLSGRLGLPFPVVIPAAGVVTALVGMIFGVPSLRLKGLYLAVATLAAHFVVEFTAVHWESVTGGVNGISIPAPKVGPLVLRGDRGMYALALPIAAAMLLGARNLFRTKVGKAFVAIRDQDISAEVMGVNVFKYKLLSFGVSSFYVGVAGSLTAYHARIISPENFPITVAIDYLGMIIIGGLGSILGSILGAVFITLLPELLRVATGALSDQFPGLVGLFAPLKMGLFGLAIVLFLVFEPDGMAARWHKIKAYWKLYPFSY
jgi:branched-chain amino acid transport system permease protein